MMGIISNSIIPYHVLRPGKLTIWNSMQERIELAQTALHKGLTQLEWFLCITLTRDTEN